MLAPRMFLDEWRFELESRALSTFKVVNLEFEGQGRAKVKLLGATRGAAPRSQLGRFFSSLMSRTLYVGPRVSVLSCAHRRKEAALRTATATPRTAFTSPATPHCATTLRVRGRCPGQDARACERGGRLCPTAQYPVPLRATLL